MKSGTLVVFHRCGGKSLGYPPNTLLTAKWAQDFGAKAVEYDIVYCDSDDGGKIVAIEPKLLKQAELDINELNWRDVSRIDTGNEKFGKCSPTLLETMLGEISTADVAHQVHIKGSNPKTLGILLLKVRNATNYVLATFDIAVIKDIRARDTDISVGWIVKPKQEKGGEGSEDLTAAVTGSNDLPPYTDGELEKIIEEAKEFTVQIVILCGPRIQDKKVIDFVRTAGFEVGAWGVGTNLDLARQLLSFQIDRFTLDNPEQL